MRVSVSWLSELVELPKGITADEIAQKLTSAGLEVEGVLDLSAPLKGVIVARVARFVPHPNADKLRVVTIESGSQAVQVVCGAANFVEGDFVALAPPGTTLPGGQRIEAAVLRGVESAGMLCSERELGLSTKHEGIIVFSADELQVGVGAPVARALSLDDTVLVIGVTPNRADALSHMGIARELAAVLKTRMKASSPTCAERGGPVDALAVVTIEDLEGCPRYAARVIEGVTIGDSPRWLQARLAAVGIRSINAVVDVTNYVMMERGVPLHAFDHDKVGRGVRGEAKIVVRRAKQGEVMTTLDGKERILLDDDVVIADPERAIALAGVMGGAQTEVSATTTRVLLECANFQASRIRKTARRLGLHSEASHRFERGCDPNGVQQSIDRAASLLAELAGGRVARGIVDVYPKKIQPLVVKLRPKKAAALTGLPPKMVDEGNATKILLSLGLEVEGREGEALRFRVPTFRTDLTREVDLIEELLRMIGYDVVPPTLPSRAGEAGSLFDGRKHSVALRARGALEAAGYDEAINLAFVSPTRLDPFDGGDDAGRIRIQNPLGEELSVLRRSLLPGLVENAATNHRRGQHDVRLYEHATVFAGRNPGGKAPRIDDANGPVGGDAWAVERPRIAGIATGATGASGFDRKPALIDFFDVKGTLEEILTTLGVPVGLVGSRASFRAAGDKHPYLHPGRRAELVVLDADRAEHTVAVIGELHPDLVERAGLKGRAVVFEIDVDALAAVAPDVPTSKPLPRYPAVKRDFALVLHESVPVSALALAIEANAAAAALLEDLDVFDVYQGKGIPEGKRSVALSIVLRAADRTLTDEEVQKISDALLDDAKARFGAEVRA